MSSLLDSHGRIGRGAYAGRFIFFTALTAILIVITLHYAGRVWPNAYYANKEVAKEAEEEKQKATELHAASLAVAAAPANASVTKPGEKPATGATALPGNATTVAAAGNAASSPPPAAPPAAATVAAAPASTPAKPAANAMVAPGNATAAASHEVAPGAPGVSATAPHYSSLHGFDRQAFGNVSIFISIVLAILGLGALCSQTIQRLRDAGKPGIWCLLLLVPGVNLLLALILMVLPSREPMDEVHAH